MKYSPTWDLTTIPEAPFKSEIARRTALMRKPLSRDKLEPCGKCGQHLNATQRRKPCPKCAYRAPQWWKTK